MAEIDDTPKGEESVSSHSRGRRRLGLLAAGIALLAPTAAQAAQPPYLVGHPYRHGAVPFRGSQGNPPAANPSGIGALSSNNLSYRGGISGVGVTTGAEKVYLVFWGSQWGTQSTNGSGSATFSGDPKGLAPDVQAFMKGLGTGSETWSGVMTQYCQGVSTGAQTCPTSNTQHVAYPTGGALAGVWEDTASAAPSAASAHAIGAEAVIAATHFGNTTQASNLNAQYVIISPTGTDPDSYKSGGFCAWHDYTGDSTLDGGGAVSSADGTLAFTNLPYLTDAGASCGQGFVNSPGTLDGVTIVEGHEYAETITDTWPAGGWTDASGYETGDKCAWISSGQGASQNITLTTGTFAVQSTWANDFNGGAGGCEVSHSIVTNGGNTVTVTNPGNQTSTVGTAVSLQMQATDSASGQTLTYSATGLPAGLSINSSSGLISGTPTTATTSSVVVTATDTTAAKGTASFSWTVSATSSCAAKQLLGNPGFETGSASPWTATRGVIENNSAGETAHSGSWYAWLDGYGKRHTDTLAQKVSIASGCHTDTFSFWLHIDTSEHTSSAVDTLKVQVLNSSGAVLATLATYSNLNAASGYVQKSFNVSAYAGETITVKFTGVETDAAGGTTSFVIDDTALNQAS
jgi:serine protease